MLVPYLNSVPESESGSLECRCAVPFQGEKKVHPTNNQVAVAMGRASKEYPGIHAKSLAEAIGIDYGSLLKNKGEGFRIKPTYNTKGFAFRLLVTELEDMLNSNCAHDGYQRRVEIPKE